MFTQFHSCQVSGVRPTFSTRCYPLFEKFRKQWYNENEHRKAYIPLEYIEKLDELGLLVWYLDDGGKSVNSMKIYSSLFNKDNIDKTINIINSNLNLSLYRGGTKIRNGKLINWIFYHAFL